MKKNTSPFKASLIALVSFILSGCSSISHFNDLAEKEEKESGDPIPYLELKRGEHVADLGAGGGYYSFRLAAAVGESGRVYAVDIDPESIAYIRKTAEARKIHHIETILAAADDPRLKKASIDLVFIRNAYHDFKNRIPYFTRLKTALKPGGRIAIIDYDPSKLGFFQKLFGHALEVKTIVDEMKEAGYIRIKSHSMLKRQSFNIFVVQ